MKISLRSEQWRKRAEECRTLAEVVTTPSVQRDYIDVAKAYEILADNADAEKPKRKLERPPWRKNAIKLRLLAEDFDDLARDNLLHLAKQWDALADQIEKKTRASNTAEAASVGDGGST